MSAVKLEKMDCSRGAPMGRCETGEATSYPVKFSLCRIYLDSGGYDNGSAYWGFPNDLYRARGNAEGMDQTRYCRANSRAEAKELIREEYPNCTFLR